jgi:hypothetical protein
MKRWSRRSPVGSPSRIPHSVGLSTTRRGARRCVRERRDQRVARGGPLRRTRERRRAQRSHRACLFGPCERSAGRQSSGDGARDHRGRRLTRPTCHLAEPSDPALRRDRGPRSWRTPARTATGPACHAYEGRLSPSKRRSGLCLPGTPLRRRTLRGGPAAPGGELPFTGARRTANRERPDLGPRRCVLRLSASGSCGITMTGRQRPRRRGSRGGDRILVIGPPGVRVVGCSS